MASYAGGLDGSALTGTETRARFPALFVSTWLGPNMGSWAREACSFLMAACTAGVFTLPSTTIWAGSARPPEKSRASTVKARFDCTSFGYVLTPENPVLMPNTGSAAAMRMAASRSRRRYRNGTFPAFTLSPITPRMAGSRVSEADTATSTTAMAPVARDRKIVVGMSSMPHSASTTVIPEKNTARLAVPPATAMASTFSRPRCRSSRYRDTTNSE